MSLPRISARRHGGVEEARVELAAAFVCNSLGLPTDCPNHAAYVATWLKKLKSAKYEIFRCTAEARLIADWTPAYHPAYAARNDASRPPDNPDGQSPGALIL